MLETGSVATETVAISRPLKAPLPGYLAKPAGNEKAPGMLIIHEAGGLNDNIREIARRFAAAGYVALAVDLFADGNRVLCMLRVMGGALIRPLDNAGLRDLGVAIDWLRGRPEVDTPRAGVIGFCMGGGFALALACVNDHLKASAVFYGGNPRPLSAVADACPIVGSYPGRDPFTRGGAVKLERALTGYGVPHDIKIYPNAQHAFFNDRLPTYSAEAARDAWERTLAFFHTHLDELPNTQGEDMNRSQE
jgi:carboxymethylenebutenolidase